MKQATDTVILFSRTQQQALSLRYALVLGMVGCGKTTVARRLADTPGAILVNRPDGTETTGVEYWKNRITPLLEKHTVVVVDELERNWGEGRGHGYIALLTRSLLQYILWYIGLEQVRVIACLSDDYDPVSVTNFTDSSKLLMCRSVNIEWTDEDLRGVPLPDHPPEETLDALRDTLGRVPLSAYLAAAHEWHHSHDLRKAVRAGQEARIAEISPWLCGDEEHLRRMGVIRWDGSTTRLYRRLKPVVSRLLTNAAGAAGGHLPPNNATTSQ